jgi:hypothetical protein
VNWSQLPALEEHGTAGSSWRKAAAQRHVTEVTWDMGGPTPYIGKIIHVLPNMDKLAGINFAMGLANLKAIAEK